MKHLRETKRNFTCPNGHTLNYTGTTETEKKIAALEYKIHRLESDINQYNLWLKDARSREDALTQSNAALRGTITKLQKMKAQRFAR